MINSPNRPEDGWLLPAVVNPDRIGVCVPVPDDDNHRRAFLDALRFLTWGRNWQYDEIGTAEAVGVVWLEIYREVAEKLHVLVCEEEQLICKEYPNTAPFINYYPNDPRYSPTLVGAGYNSPAWYFSTPASQATYGTSPGDIVTSLDRFPPGSLPTIIPASGFPRVRINVNVVAGGVVRIYLRNMIAGSLVQFTADDDITTLYFYDVNLDLISIPAETGSTTIIEHTFDDAGPHHIDLIVVSKLNDEIPFLHHGAGLVRVEICGEAEEGQVDCCDTTITLVETVNNYNRQEKNIYRGDIYMGSPTDIHINAPTVVFAGEGDGDRNTALCMALREYIYNQTWRAAMQRCAELGAATALAAVGGFLIGGPLGSIVGGVIVLAAAVGDCDAIQTEVMNTENLQETLCQVYAAFNGVAVSEANFNSIMGSVSGPSVTISTILASGADDRANYLWFLDLLGNAYTQAQAGATDDCSCPILCDTTIDWRVAATATEIILGTRVAGQGIVAPDLGGLYKFDVRVRFADLVNCAFEIDYWRADAGGNALFVDWEVWEEGVLISSSGSAVSATSGENTRTEAASMSSYNALRIYSGLYNVQTTLREIRLL